MAYDTSLAEPVTDQFTARRVPFMAKATMGGLCFMVDGKMCLGVVGDSLMVRLDPRMEAEALTRSGCRPMDFTGRPMKGFVFVGPEGTESEGSLNEWLELALRFNPHAKAARKPSPGKLKKQS